MLQKTGHYSHDIKSFAIGSFLDGIVVEGVNDYLCWKTLKMLVRLSQNRLIISKIYPEDPLEISHMISIVSQRSLPWKLVQIGLFFCEFVPENPAKIDIFLRDLSEALFLRWWQCETCHV